MTNLVVQSHISNGMDIWNTSPESSTGSLAIEGAFHAL